MNTVGDIFRSKRLEKRFTINDVELATKIRSKFIQAIETNSFSSLPSQAYTKGFIQNYARFLGLNSLTMLAFYRRQTQELSKSSLLPHRQEAVLRPSFFRLTPTRFLTLIGLAIVMIFLGYFGWQYKSLQSPPVLTIESPPDKFSTQNKRIDIIGTTNTDATVVINGISVLVREDGKFFDQVDLVAGVNKITIRSTSKLGKIATKVIEVSHAE